MRLATPSPSELLGEVEYSATDYFGNEGSEAAFYVTATLAARGPARPLASEGAGGLREP